MTKNEIKEQVLFEINKWQDLTRENGYEIVLSEKSIEFICTLIDNIETDRSPLWRKTGNLPSQKTAISLIVNGLNDLMLNYRYKFRENSNKLRSFKITTWEIWHNLSRILDHYNILPKDI